MKEGILIWDIHLTRYTPNRMAFGVYMRRYCRCWLGGVSWCYVSVIILTKPVGHYKHLRLIWILKEPTALHRPLFVHLTFMPIQCTNSSLAWHHDNNESQKEIMKEAFCAMFLALPWLIKTCFLMGLSCPDVADKKWEKCFEHRIPVSNRDTYRIGT
jgi:hypothetical protein